MDNLIDISQNTNTKRSINRYIGGSVKLNFGDYILFQEYIQYSHDGTQYSYSVSKPILAIYLGCFVVDQTLGFNYVRWNNDQHTIHYTLNDIEYSMCKEVTSIEHHIEWSNYIDILGHWQTKPNWKQIIKSYRQQNIKQYMKSDEIDWT